MIDAIKYIKANNIEPYQYALLIGVAELDLNEWLQEIEELMN